MESKLAKKQEDINKTYKKKGATKKVLTNQIEVNKIRNEKNLPDESEYVYKNYVQ